jgi:hypothetical protein
MDILGTSAGIKNALQASRPSTVVYFPNGLTVLNVI